WQCGAIADGHDPRLAIGNGRQHRDEIDCQAGRDERRRSLLQSHRLISFAKSFAHFIRNYCCSPAFASGDNYRFCLNPTNARARTYCRAARRGPPEEMPGALRSTTLITTLPGRESGAQAVGEVTGLAGSELKRLMRTGTVASVDNRNWEIGDPAIIRRRSQSRAIALDMDSAAIAANGFRFRVPFGTF